MDWQAIRSKFNGKSTKEPWLMLLGLGLICLILAFPVGADKSLEDETTVVATSEEMDSVERLSYEQQLEERLEEILSHVEGVGSVEVMIVLKTSEEKIWRVDQDTSHSITQESDQNGGSRRVENQDVTQDTILTGQDGKETPILEKEIKPQIGGVIISASGGGSPLVQAEISAAVEALFEVPSHKIKVLKRVE